MKAEAKAKAKVAEEVAMAMATAAAVAAAAAAAETAKEAAKEAVEEANRKRYEAHEQVPPSSPLACLTPILTCHLKPSRRISSESHTHSLRRPRQRWRRRRRLSTCVDRGQRSRPLRRSVVSAVWPQPIRITD